ncbi:MAG: hypothetical protein H0X40_16250 [Chthoniobacterales bacterium]|nr:hypothetical protein [Chthoniobacterales bacterium]
MKRFIILAAVLVTLTMVVGPARAQDATETFAVADDGTELKWDVYLPPGIDARPVVLVLHTGGFKTGRRNDPGVKVAATELAQGGFIACAIDYRLDLRRINGNGGLAYAPVPGATQLQVDDVRQAILAARNPAGTSLLATRGVTGKVGAVGGSAGAAHSLWCSLTGTAGADQFDCAALLSGAYEFDDRNSLAATTGGCDLPDDFAFDVAMYCLTVKGASDYYNQLHTGSPIYQIVHGVTVPPLDLIASIDDPITPTQIQDLQLRLQVNHVPNYLYQVLIGDYQPNNRLPQEHCAHAFQYWDYPYDSVSGLTVGEQVTSWLGQYLD